MIAGWLRGEDQLIAGITDYQVSIYLSIYIFISIYLSILIYLYVCLSIYLYIVINLSNS